MKHQECKGEGPGRTIRMGKRLTVDELPGLRKELLAASENELTLDLGEVEDCDAAGMQFLIALNKVWVPMGKKFRLADLSPTLCGILQAAGIKPDQLGGRATLKSGA